MDYEKIKISELVKMARAAGVSGELRKMSRAEIIKKLEATMTEANVSKQQIDERQEMEEMAKKARMQNKSLEETKNTPEKSSEKSPDLARTIAEAISAYVRPSESIESLRKDIEELKRAGHKTLKIQVGANTTELTGIQHHKFEEALRVLATGTPLMLTGPSGSGKTHSAIKMAEALGLDYYSTSCSADMNLSRLTGYMDAEGRYVEGDLYKPYVEGGVYCIDEMDASPAEVVVALNSAIENGHLTFPCGRKKASENFRVIACANTWGHGATSFYTARCAIDIATLRRFAKIEWGYCEELEKSILSEQTAEDLKKIRGRANLIGARVVVSTGQGLKVDRLISGGFSRHDAWKMMVTEGLDSTTQKSLMNEIGA